MVGKTNAGGCRRQKCESELAGSGYRHLPPAIARTGLPVQPGSSKYSSDEAQEHRTDNDPSRNGHEGPGSAQTELHYRRTVIFPLTSTSTSRAPAGTSFVVVAPPGHRSHNRVAGSGVPRT